MKCIAIIQIINNSTIINNYLLTFFHRHSFFSETPNASIIGVPAGIEYSPTVISSSE